MTMIKIDLGEKQGRRMGIDPVSIFLVIIVIIFTGGFYFYGTTLQTKIDAKQAEISDLETKIQGLYEKIPKIKNIQEENKELEAQINTIKQLVYDPVRYANMLDEIALVIPNNIYLKSMSIEPAKETIKITGLAVYLEGYPPLESISEFIKNIQKSKYFKEANLQNTTRQGQGNSAQQVIYTFNIDIKYNPDAAVR